MHQTATTTSFLQNALNTVTYCVHAVFSSLVAYNSGTQRDGKGDLDAPSDLCTANVALLHRTQWPLFLFTPLLAAALGKMKPVSILDSNLHPLELCEGIPLASLDMFTRGGKAVVRELQQTVPELNSFSTQQIGLAIFYTEGGRLDKTLSNETLEYYACMGEAADIEAAGLSIPEYLALKDIVVRHHFLRAEIRKRELRRSLREQQTDLFGVA